MGRKTKYCEDIVQQICNAIALEGRDSSGYEEAGIDSATFYRWMNQYHEFRDRVARARAVHRLTCPESLRLQGKKKLAEYLFSGHVVRREVINSEGEVVELKTNFNTPAWAIKMVVPPQHLDAAIQVVQEAGYLVIDPLAMKKEGVKRGLTPETMGLIRSEILGIDGVRVTPELAKEIDITPVDDLGD